MPDLLAATATNEALDVLELVAYLATLILLVVLLILDIRYMSASRKLAKTLNLPKGQWLRPAKTLAFDPVIELVAVGLVLAKDIVQNWQHLLAAIVGVAVGLTVGHYRYRIQYVRVLPEYKAIVFVRSNAEYLALAVLLLVSFASEQHQIPVVGPLTLLITIGLAIVVSESVGRSWFAYRRYRQDMAAGSQSPAG